MTSNRPEMPDARDRVIGTLPMVLNHHLPGMLHATVVRSQIPHGTVIGLDVSAALELPGVVAVLTAADCADASGAPLLFGDAIADQPVLAAGRVRYVGDPVALVIADDATTAAEAASRVYVDYEELPYVTDAESAMRPDAVVLHPQHGTNELSTWRLRHGDVDAALANADHVFDDVFTSPSASHVPMEPHVALAYWEQNELTVWSSTQSPHAVRQTLAKCFGLSHEQVRVLTLNVGGAYGSKVVTTIEPLVAAAARHVGRPVRIQLSRAEVFHTLCKHAARVRVQTGVMNDGRIVARAINVLWNAGAYATNSRDAAGYGMVRAPGPYEVPNVSVTSTTVYTNTVPAGPFRGAMTSQLCWAYESQMDDIARHLGIEPIVLRRLNLLRDGGTYPTGEVMHDLHFDELIDAVTLGLEQVPPPAPVPGRLRGRGLALMIKSTQTPSRSECRLRLHEDGTYELLVASVEMGQGAHATLRSLAAAALGVDESLVVVRQPDTSEAPYDSLTASSRTTFAMGSAIRDAAARLQALLAASPNGERPLEAHGCWESTGGITTLDENGQGMATTHWHQGAVAVEAEVDLETGKVTVLRAAGACHAGRVVSPSRVRHQNEGGMIFGLGPALFEELIYNDGQLATSNLSEYMIPSLLDTPSLVSTATESAGHGELHGVGEMTVPPMAPAIANAVFDACGLRVRDLPLRPERVLRAILGKTMEEDDD